MLQKLNAKVIVAATDDDDNDKDDEFRINGQYLTISILATTNNAVQLLL